MTDGGSHIDWLRLIRSENVGPKTFYALLTRFGSPAKALAALPDLAAKGGKRSIKICSEKAAKIELEQIAEHGASLITRADPDYPSLLTQIDDAPPVLTVIGRKDLLAKPMLAIVGARNASMNGRTLANQIATEVGQAGFVIASGLARGIDRAAHVGGLKTGTIGVVAGGIDKIYPKENTDLYEKMAVEGLIISETRFGEAPIARHFPKRNRIVAGLSLGILVVEAAQRSGSLITARMAAEQNRDVFAIPGSPLDERARGSNSLIRQGAHLVESAADIVSILPDPTHIPFSEPETPFLNAPPPPTPDEAVLSPLRPKLRELLGPSPVQIDVLIRELDAPAHLVAVLLLELDLAGRLAREAGGKVALVTPSDTGLSF